MEHLKPSVFVIILLYKNEKKDTEFLIYFAIIINDCYFVIYHCMALFETSNKRT